jgi:hypothetical protein
VISVDSAATYLRQEALLSRDGTLFGLEAKRRSLLRRFCFRLRAKGLLVFGRHQHGVDYVNDAVFADDVRLDHLGAVDGYLVVLGDDFQ